MKTIIKNIEHTRGSSYGFNFRVEDAEGAAVELDACYFSCKEKLEDTEYAFQKTIDRGITRLSDGDYYVKIEPADTRNLELKAYYYDLEIWIGNDNFTPLKGKLDIKWDVTRE